MIRFLLVLGPVEAFSFAHYVVCAAYPLVL